jgi:hypothetical protein
MMSLDHGAHHVARFGRPFRPTESPRRAIGLRADLDHHRGKVAEEFDAPVGDWLDRHAAEQARRGRPHEPSARAPKRFSFLCEVLQLDVADILDLRNQLLSGVSSLETRELYGSGFGLGRAAHPATESPDGPSPRSISPIRSGSRRLGRAGSP